MVVTLCVLLWIAAAVTIVLCDEILIFVFIFNLNLIINLEKIRIPSTWNSVIDALAFNFLVLIFYRVTTRYNETLPRRLHPLQRVCAVDLHL